MKESGLRLLSLGIGLVALAAIVFAGFAYAQMDNGMRAVAIGVLGIVSLLCSVALSRRVKVTSEGLGYLGAGSDNAHHAYSNA